MGELLFRKFESLFESYTGRKRKSQFSKRGSFLENTMVYQQTEQGSGTLEQYACGFHIFKCFFFFLSQHNKKKSELILRELLSQSTKQIKQYLQQKGTEKTFSFIPTL